MLRSHAAAGAWRRSVSTVADMSLEDAWADPDVLMWDWRGQPDIESLREILARFRVDVEEINTGSDEYAVKFSRAEIPPEHTVHDVHHDLDFDDRIAGTQ